MGFRFHKSRSIIPGVRLNLSKSGLSLSLGPQGARLNIGPKGVRTTLGVPGTGVSHVTQKSWAALSEAWKTEPVRQAPGIDLSAMPDDQARTAFVRLLAASPLAEVQQQREAFDAYLKDHPGEIPEAQITALRQLYADEIARKSVLPPSTQQLLPPGAGEDRDYGGMFSRAKPILAAFWPFILAVVILAILVLTGAIR
jgi:Protein of unknown function (DUF4236)